MTLFIYIFESKHETLFSITLNLFEILQLTCVKLKMDTNRENTVKNIAQQNLKRRVTSKSTVNESDAKLKKQKVFRGLRTCRPKLLITRKQVKKRA